MAPALSGNSSRITEVSDEEEKPAEAVVRNDPAPFFAPAGGEMARVKPFLFSCSLTHALVALTSGERCKRDARKDISL
jgi:hypothetical protein